MSNYQVNPNDPLPRYYQVYHSLLERIRAGEFAPGQALPAERRLTDEYGVSRITIVKALDLLDQDGLIERQHGRGTFVTNPADRAKDEPLSIAFLPGVFDHPYLLSVLLGIAHSATRQNCHLQVMGAYENSQEETRYANEAIERGIDGLIVYPRPGYENVALYQRLQDEGYPIVLVDRYYPQVETDRVVFGDEEAAFALTTRLLQRGHERIAVLTHHEVETTSVRDRLNGYRRALLAHDLPYDEDLLWLDVYGRFDPLQDESPNRPSSFSNRLQARLEQERPTALLTINQDVARRLSYDLMAITTARMRAVIEGDGATDYDLSLELATFSHSHSDNYGPNVVARAIHSGEQLGQKAAELLIGRITGEVTGAPQRVTVPMQITSATDA